MGGWLDVCIDMYACVIFMYEGKDTYVHRDILTWIDGERLIYVFIQRL